MKNREKSIFDFIFECIPFILLFVIIFVVIGAIICIFHTGNYQYVDIDGNTGHSNKCYAHYGAMYCLVDGGKIMVKQYQEDK